MAGAGYAVPDGWQLVPKVATTDMLYEAQEGAHILPPRGQRIWQMMLAAVRNPPLPRDRNAATGEAKNGAAPVPMASSAGEPCHNCGGLGYRREASGEQIPCDLCQDALEPVRARIEQAIREHCEGGDLWMVSHIAAKAITAPPAASLREQEWESLYRRMKNCAGGYSNLCEEDRPAARQLEKEYAQIDQEARNLIDAQRLGRGKDGAS
jgi:hypothetical protein